MASLTGLLRPGSALEDRSEDEEDEEDEEDAGRKTGLGGIGDESAHLCPRKSSGLHLTKKKSTTHPELKVFGSGGDHFNFLSC
jgi:hypothetical protein